MTKYSLALMLVAVLLGGLLPSATAQRPSVKVLYVTGENNHDWPFTSKHWIEVLEGTGRFEVTRTEAPASYLADNDLSAFDLIFLDYNGKRWGEPAEAKFSAAVRAGLGVFILHAANNAFPGWTDYEAISCMCFREEAGHGAFHAFDVRVDDRNHPITMDLPHLKAHPDELYHRMKTMPGASFRVLMSAQSSTANGGSGRREPMALVGEFGKGRIFHTTLGHVWPGEESQRASVEDPQLQLLVARGAEWAATGDCRIRPEKFGLKPHRSLAKRPRSPWAMRCVLDGRARMIVLGLDEHMSVAFDATHCEPYVVWAGGLKLQGAVFDSVHGPQPEIIGLPLWRNEKIAKSPVVVGDEGRSNRYLGYRLDQGHITFSYRPIGRPEVLVQESFEHGKSGTILLHRRLRISGLQDGETIPVRECKDAIDDAGQVEPSYQQLGNGIHVLHETFEVTSGVKS